MVLTLSRIDIRSDVTGFATLRTSSGHSVMQRLTIIFPLALALTLAACEGYDSAEPTEAGALHDQAGIHFDTAEPGRVAISGDATGELIVLDQALVLRLDGADHNLTLDAGSGQLEASWGAEAIDLGAEHSGDLGLAVELAEQALSDARLLDHLVAEQPSLAEQFKWPTLNPCFATGCSSHVCADEEVFTTCEWRPEYACVALTTCGTFGENGSCAWDPTPEYLACLESSGGATEQASEAPIDNPVAEEEESWGSCGCETNADCVKTVGGCCPCNAGGQEIAVAEQCLDQVPGCDLKPGEFFCPQVFLCTQSVAICDAGQCVLSDAL